MNLDHIADDIRQVMEVQRNQPDTNAPRTVTGPTFDLASEIRKETERAYPVRDAALTRRLDLLQSDMTQAMIDFGRSEVENRMVAAIKDAEGKGAKW